ncbi:snRNA-activating protein complex subunit 4 [Lissotriton helveticus]
MSVEDLNAERERIRKEIAALEKSLDPKDASIEVVVSDSISESASESAEDLEDEDSDGSYLTDEERGEEKSDDETDRNLPASLETCLQINLVYQEVIQEKLQEVTLLLSQNKERQEDILWQLSGPRIRKTKLDDHLKGHVFIGRFMKPYFKDSATGCGPPANQDTREKAAQCIKSFQEVNVAKWKTREKTLLKDSVLSDSLQHLLQPKLFKHEYLTQKLEKVKDEMSKQIVEKQIRETLREIDDINQLSDERLVGQRTDEHDWEKISNVHFEGTRTASELRKFWQNSEHPSINKNEWSEEEVETLQIIAAEHNCTDWQSIADELGTSRTAFQCLQKFQKYNKTFKKREWTKEEDQMLTHLVEQMRVGIHIPYQKIAYYMEGRDTFQLIYRWTKSVDPRLKKGPWTPEEDAKLLQAVSIHGERYWYKIREEVPGRSDSQCRDRYRKALDKRVKKGRWSQAEKAKFLELLDKYGVGHWAKIASELPNRTDSQCLNKWKIIAGYKKNKKRLKKKKDEENENNNLPDSSEEEEEMSSESSSDETEEMEIEFMDSSEEETEPVKVIRRPTYPIPAVDLWVPTQDHTLERRHKIITALSISRSAQSSKNSKEPSAKDATPTSRKKVGPSSAEGNEPMADSPWCYSTIVKGFGSSYMTDVTTDDPTQMLKEACDNGKYVFRVNMADVRKVLRRNTSCQRTKRVEKMKRLCSGIYPEMSQIYSGLSLDQMRDVLHRAKEQGARHNIIGLRNSTIDRKLLMAVTPWVGNVIVVYSLRPTSSLRSGTKADSIKEQVHTIKLSSTPVFALLLQLFKIDADGCLQVIRERKTQESEVLEAVPHKSQSAVQPPKIPPTPLGRPGKRFPPRVPPRVPPVPPGTLPNTTNALSGLKTSSGNTESLGYRMPRPFRVPKEKPKTVWELLREKRMKNSASFTSAAPCGKAVAVGPRLLTPQLLIALQPKPGSSQPHPLPSPKNPFPLINTAQAPLLPLPSPAASSASRISIRLSERQSKCVDGSTLSQEKSAGSDKSVIHNKGERTPISSSTSVSHTSSPDETSFKRMVGNSLTSQSLQGQAAMTCPVPAGKEIAQAAPNATTVALQTKASMSKAGSSVPIYSQKSILSLMPAVSPSQRGPQNLTNTLMPFTWVVTPQGPVPVPAHTLFGFPSSSLQMALPKTEFNVPSGCLLPLAGISGDKVSAEGERLSVTNANTNVTSSPAAPTSNSNQPSIKSVKDEVAKLRCPTDILPSAASVPVQAVPVHCPNSTESCTSGELGAASPSSGPSFMAVLPPANKPMVISSAELQCSLSLISLSKGGVTELEESPSFQSEAQKIGKKRSLVQTFSDTFVQAPKRPLTSVTIPIPKAESVQCPVVARSLATPPVASSSIHQIKSPVIIARSQTPATYPVVSKDMNQICPAVSIAVRSPATPSVASTNMTKNLPLMSAAVKNPTAQVLLSSNNNQIRLPMSFGVMSALTPPCSSVDKKPNQLPVSALLAKSAPTPPLAGNSMNHTQPPVSVTAKSPFPATLLKASNENKNIQPHASIAVTNVATPHIASDDKNKGLPLVSVAVRNPATQVVFSSNQNQIQLPVPLAVRSPATAPGPGNDKNQIQPSVSVVARSLATALVLSNDKNQIQPSVSIVPRSLATAPGPSNDKNQIQPSVSVVARSLATAHVLSKNKTQIPLSVPVAARSLAAAPVPSNDKNQIQPSVSIVRRILTTAPGPSNDKNQIYPPFSTALRSLATAPVPSKDENQIQPSVSSVPRSLGTPPGPSNVKNQINPPLSTALRSLATAPVPGKDDNQIQHPVSTATVSFATLPVSVKGQNQICPPVSVSAVCATPPVSINNQIHPPIYAAARSSTTQLVASNSVSHIPPPVSITSMSAATLPVSSADKNQIQPPVSVGAKTPATPLVSATDNSKNHPPVSGTEKKVLDLSIVSLEDEGKVKSWLKGAHGVHVPPLKDDLPYMPPSTCNLKTLSRLLQQKKVLEKNALRLLQSNEENKERTTDKSLEVIEELVAHKLKDNPAYLLLKARFLSAFTLPAFLATMPPPGIRTTIRSTHYTYGDTDDEVDDYQELVVEYDEMDSTDDECKQAIYNQENPLAKMQLDSTAKSLPTTQCDAQPDQETHVEASCSHAVPDGSVVTAESTKVQQTRRSTRQRKAPVRK